LFGGTELDSNCTGLYSAKCENALVEGESPSISVN